MLGRRVAVYGGGNTAFDVARTAKRLGAEEAVVVYRRTRDRMPAHDSELQEALEEGVPSSGSRQSERPTAGGSMIERMELDESGFPQPTGELEELEADSLVLALGQESDLGLLERADGVEIEDGVVQSRRGPDDRSPRRVRGRRHRAGRAHRHRRRRARRGPPAGIDAWLRGEHARRSPRASPRRSTH